MNAERLTREIAEDVALARLARYEAAREERMAFYRLHWQQRWDAQQVTPPSRTKSDRFIRVVK